MVVEHEWQPTPWYLNWRGRERRLVVITDWYFDWVSQVDRYWEYR